VSSQTQIPVCAPDVSDFSLLLGIDGSTKQIACGLVDAIGLSSHLSSMYGADDDVLHTGSYTFAKTLEYKAKQGLNSGKQVTVVPPHEYQHRFVKAMNDYFVPCPGMLSASFLRCLSSSTISQTNGPPLMMALISAEIRGHYPVYSKDKVTIMSAHS
jgi:hypothetical protein